MKLFAERLSADVEGVKQRLEKIFGGGEAVLASVVFGKIKVEELSGKRSTEMTLERILQLTA